MERISARRSGISAAVRVQAIGWSVDIEISGFGGNRPLVSTLNPGSSQGKFVDEPNLTIGQVAQRAGINTSAIRYYERVGLLPQPERQSGQRRYTEETVRQLGVIDVAKRAGFTLDDARALLATSADGGPAHEEIRDLANRKLPEVRALIVRAEAMERWLLDATSCACDTIDVCALFADERSLPEPRLELAHTAARAR
jgi:MerR family redox-sensitive transcriptional activator SoxR